MGTSTSPWFAAALTAVLPAAPADAAPVPLKVVDVHASALACVFSPACTSAVIDTGGSIPLPGEIGAGSLGTRTFKGERGTPGAGKNGYMYQVTLKNAGSASAQLCVSAVRVTLGPVSQLQYDGAGPLDQVFVVTKGGLGSIGVKSAYQVGDVVTVIFSKPVCAGTGGAAGRRASTSDSLR